MEMPVQPKNNGMAIASLVVGIVSLVFIFIFPILGVIAGIVGIILSVKAKKEIAVTQEGGSGMATAGMVCSIIGLAINGLMMICALAVLGTIGAAGCAAASSGF